MSNQGCSNNDAAGREAVKICTAIGAARGRGTQELEKGKSGWATTVPCTNRAMPSIKHEAPSLLQHRSIDQGINMYMLATHSRRGAKKLHRMCCADQCSGAAALASCLDSLPHHEQHPPSR